MQSFCKCISCNFFSWDFIISEALTRIFILTTYPKQKQLYIQTQLNGLNKITVWRKGKLQLEIKKKYIVWYNLLDSPVRLLFFTTVPLPMTVKAFKLTLYTEYGSRRKIENINDVATFSTMKLKLYYLLNLVVKTVLQS
jgi:hypothetical protein